MVQEPDLTKKDVDGVERQQYLPSQKTPHEPDHLNKAFKIIRGNFDVAVLSEMEGRPCICVLECKGCFKGTSALEAT